MRPYDTLIGYTTMLAVAIAASIYVVHSVDQSRLARQQRDSLAAIQNLLVENNVLLSKVHSALVEITFPVESITELPYCHGDTTEE